MEVCGSTFRNQKPRRRGGTAGNQEDDISLSNTQAADPMPAAVTNGLFVHLVLEDPVPKGRAGKMVRATLRPAQTRVLH